MNGRGWMFGLLAVVLAGLIGVGSYYLGRQPAWDRPLETSRAVAASPVATGGTGLGSQRVALVMGNGNYADHPLRRPVQDASDMATLLKTLGFAVMPMATDLTLEQMESRVREFITSAKAAEVRLFYYSGHGANYQNQSYLLPVGHGIERAYDMKRKAFPLDALLDGLKEEAPGGVNIVLLDACRDEPFGRQSKSVGGSKGMIPLVTAGSGTLVAYAAGSGEQAMELAGDRNSLFTKHLLQQLREREDLRMVLTTVRAKVEKENPAQVPETSDKLRQRLYLAGEPEADRPQPPATTGILAIKRSQPPGVVIYVDGARLGEAPQELEGLPAGKPVTVTAKQAGHEDYQEKVWIRAGQRSELNVVLTARSVPPVSPPVVVTPPPVERPREAFEPELVALTGGCFQMGSPANETDRSSDEEQHQVCVKGFEMGRHEVTQQQWQAVMGDNPSNFSGCADCPVERVSWNDVQNYLRKLNQQTGKKYRLPTEVEWEYACRGGKAGRPYCGGNDIDSVAWYGGNSGGKTHPVGQKAANGFGLYDMSGNVWEWTCSAYDSDYGGAEKECTNNNTNNPLAVRGGGWDSIPAGVRSAFRLWLSPALRNSIHGFRLTRSL